MTVSLILSGRSGGVDPAAIDASVDARRRRRTTVDRPEHQSMTPADTPDDDLTPDAPVGVDARGDDRTSRVGRGCLRADPGPGQVRLHAGVLDKVCGEVFVTGNGRTMVEQNGEAPPARMHSRLATAVLTEPIALSMVMS